ncbi:MAG TPA: prolipoprotein diacylglyceryl transferase family protein [Gemmataceae bacterium]|jgi:phosphatidylglycerol:prolipoprotein diacylglycerol transferase
MQQVLFRIPPGTGLPVYGFGVMLLIAISTAAWLAGRRAEREGVAKSESLYDFFVWVVLGGLIGARLFYVIWFRDQFANPFLGFFKIWDGGIVFYGSAIGGLIAGLIARRRFLSRFNISPWTLADVLAPSIAVGLCLGRIGCFLNGCCWGQVACPAAPAAHFPMMTTPAREMIRDYQTSAGFAMDPRAKDDRTVGAVEPDSAATAAGLEPGDVIEAVGGKPVADYGELARALTVDWPRGKKDVTLTVQRAGYEVTLPAYIPRTIGLIPTQIYESVSMFLIFLVLLALYPLRRYNGQVMVVLMLCYAVHRFFNESLREDTPPVGGLTVSQWISLGIFAAGVLLHLWRRRYPLRPSAPLPATQQPVAQPA